MNICTPTEKTCAPPPASQPARPYRGYYYDTETGLYYLQSRYYDPEVGRFINADNVLNIAGYGYFISNNLFAYCLNNPVNLVDCFGQLAQWIEVVENGLSSLLDQVYEAVDSFFNNIFMYKEHQKKGSTNPSNRNKHEAGQARKNRDSGNEKGDSRRKDRSNKRHDIISPYQDFNTKLVGGGLIIMSVIGIAYLALNDLTGVGIADDVAILPAFEMFKRGISMIII